MKKKRDAWDPEIPSESNFYNWTGKPKTQAARASLENAPIAVDLFSGCGGISQGFRAAGIQSALAIDIHRPSIETYRLHHPEATTILGDIRKIRDELVHEALGGAKVDVVAGGAPCQGFSLCNRKQFARDPRNNLFRQYMRIVETLKPRLVLFENVQNIRSVADGKFTRLIEAHFEDLGYSIMSGPVNALEFAVPQRRMRWIFFGVRGANKRIPWPIGDHRGCPPLTVYDAIGDLPVLGNNEGVDNYDRLPDRQFQRDMREGAKRLLNHVAPNHPEETIARIDATKQGEPMYESFKQRIRLSWGAPSPTQVCGGIRPQFQFGHPDQPRGLSIRERCRIQSFPDTYEITGGIVQGRVQTGNAVPPRVAEGFGRAIMTLLTGERRIEIRQDIEALALPLTAGA